MEKILEENKKLKKKVNDNKESAEEALMEIEFRKLELEEIDERERKLEERIEEIEKRWKSEIEIKPEEGNKTEVLEGVEGETDQGREKRMDSETFEKNKALLIRKGLKYKDEKFREWSRKCIGEVDFYIERIKNRSDIAWAVFNRKEDRDELFSVKERVKKEGIYQVDEYLTYQERKDRFELLKKADEIEKVYRDMKKDVRMVRRNKELEIDGIVYKWDKYKRELYRVKELSREEERRREEVD